jgi:hypothetical protein
MLLDPDLGWYSGPQYPNNKDNFGIFLDSMPDTWGRTLLQWFHHQVHSVISYIHYWMANAIPKDMHPVNLSV